MTKVRLTRNKVTKYKELAAPLSDNGLINKVRQGITKFDDIYNIIPTAQSHAS